jgi:hypothetical protein
LSIQIGRVAAHPPQEVVQEFICRGVPLGRAGREIFGVFLTLRATGCADSRFEGDRFVLERMAGAEAGLSFMDDFRRPLKKL